MGNKFTYGDIGVECTAEEYASQYPSVIPVLGEVYVYAPKVWSGNTVTIVYVDDRIAVGLANARWGQQIGDYFMYNASGVFAGFRYKDVARPMYRLQKPS